MMTIERTPEDLKHFQEDMARIATEKRARLLKRITDLRDSIDALRPQANLAYTVARGMSAQANLIDVLTKLNHDAQNMAELTRQLLADEMAAKVPQ